MTRRKRPKPRVKKHRLKFPLADRHLWRPTCRWCGKYAADPGEFAVFTAGAHPNDELVRRSRGGRLWFNAFLSLWWHGAHPLTRKPRGDEQYISMNNPEARMEIACDVDVGQFDLGFCSIRCLRRFWNFVADQLEQKRAVAMARAKKKGLYRFGVARRDRKSYLEPPKAKANRRR